MVKVVTRHVVVVVERHGELAFADGNVRWIAKPIAFRRYEAQVAIADLVERIFRWLRHAERLLVHFRRPGHWTSKKNQVVAIE